MKRRTVYQESIFPADRERVFRLLRELKTLQYVAAPYASFTPLDGKEDIRWEVGQRLSFRFRMFCLIPYGVHTIRVRQFSPDGIYTNESNTHVPVWNHRIRLVDNGNGTTTYSDEVEIGAGWKTGIVWLWARCFYAHRQRKWKKLLKRQEA